MFKTVTLAITGASGMPYTFRLLECLAKTDKAVRLSISSAGQMVIRGEFDAKFPSTPAKVQAYLIERYALKKLSVYGRQDWNAPMASGSGVSDVMVVCPCSMGSLATFAAGLSDNLISRAVDVTLKERKKLILVPRETPFSDIHLENMLKLSRMGAVILAANPGFYYQPQSVSDVVDFVVARILDHLNVEHDLLPRWGESSLNTR